MLSFACQLLNVAQQMTDEHKHDTTGFPLHAIDLQRTATVK